ncbi:MAG: hypothetical protein MUF64_13310 [Polyangiaceae bacterium]|jgi:hypothetical protein|nr:hypothetical protein [Polyangiaceae bacterium]
MTHRLATLSLSLLLAGCRADPAPPAPSAQATPLASTPVPSASATPAASATSAASALPPSPAAALTDAELGTLMRGISEEGGRFPSDNYISNETSFLHVTNAIEPLQGGAYIGVGPEQNFTYLALLDPQLSFLIDIRRDNLVLHLLYKVLFEQSPDRAAFLARLTSRPAPSLPPDAPVERITEAVQKQPHDRALEAATLQQVTERAQALNFSLSGEDRKHLREALAAFGKQGMEIHYTMEGSSRKYPSLGELMATRDSKGQARSFLGSDAAYQRVRRMQRENRVVPLVGDLAGTGALPRLAAELRRRQLALRVFYVSNVEQYLFSPAKTWAQWLKNVEAMPWSSDGVLLRVYFDQGRAHPRQQPGHRTTSMTLPASAFLEQSRKGVWKSWWDVAQQGGSTP